MAENEEISFSEFDDDIVRYLVEVESIRVTDNLKLVINIKGGGCTTENLSSEEDLIA